MGGFAACNPPGGSVHALFCIEVNEITQGFGTTAVGAPSCTQEHKTETLLQNGESTLLQMDSVHLNFQIVVSAQSNKCDGLYS